MKSYTIHLIRHGLTSGNEEGRYIGSTDLPLSPNGAARIKKLRSENPFPEAQAFFCSPQKRCLQTMNLLYPQAKTIRIDDLSECDFGDWEGKTAQEIAAADPQFGRWIAGNGGPVTPPHGESGGVFMHRVCAAFEKIVEGLLRSGITSAAIIAPGGALMAILSTYGLPKAQFYDWMTENGHGYSMRITPGLWMRSMVGEVYAKIPKEDQTADDNGRILIDLAREAAKEALGEKKPEEK